MNYFTLKMYHAKSKEDLFKGLEVVVNKESNNLLDLTLSLLSTPIVFNVLNTLVGAGLGFFFGKLSSSDAIAVASVGLAIGGYSVSRGLTKSSLMVLVLAAGIASLGSSGCATGVRSQLERAHLAITAADRAALELTGDKCLAAAKACQAQHVEQTACEAWQTCDKSRATYVIAASAVDAELAVINRILTDLGVE